MGSLTALGTTDILASELNIVKVKKVYTKHVMII